MRYRRALIAAHIGHARLKQRLGHREDAFAMEGLAFAERQFRDFFLERAFHGYLKSTLGSHVASGGNAMTSASASMPIPTYGVTACQTCCIAISFGATLFIVKRSMPNGGVSRPSCMQMRNSTPNQIGSKL